MKKLLLLALVALGGVMNVSAWNYLKGSFNNWTASADYCLDNGPVAVYLTASETAYTFKIHGDNWYGANNNANITETTVINSFNTSGDSDNFNLTVTTSGYYVFSVNWDNGMSLTVRYPNTTVYFYNSLGWSNVYLHDGWWNGSSASNRGALRGVAMTAGADNIYFANIPLESFYRVTFTSEKQVNNGGDQHGEGYDNFYNTSVVWNESAFNTSTPLYVPTTTESENLNSCPYYYGGSWYTYPTYTRDVTSGNFGTICLPFAATVTGATVYKIVSTVGTGASMTGVNLKSVENLEAGHAYIFKATGSTLTATYSGAYADATEADGMLGNLSATPVTVAAGYYVVSGNKICPVGESVTVGQNRAYITLNGIGVAASRGANFIGFDEATGIDNIKAENGQEVVYNLQGQRVTDAQKGLVIMGGKKMLRK